MLPDNTVRTPIQYLALFDGKHVRAVRTVNRRIQSISTRLDDTDPASLPFTAQSPFVVPVGRTGSISRFDVLERLDVEQSLEFVFELFV